MSDRDGFPFDKAIFPTSNTSRLQAERMIVSGELILTFLREQRIFNISLQGNSLGSRVTKPAERSFKLRVSRALLAQLCMQFTPQVGFKRSAILFYFLFL